MNKLPDINFLRYLTLTIPMSIENFLVQGLFEDIDRSTVKKDIKDFFNKSNQKGRKEISLYIHIPYCTDDCNYCHCNRATLRKKNDLLEYEDFIVQQIREYSSLASKGIIEYVTFGGGTPSLLSSNSVERILKEIRTNFNVNKNAKINFEASPGSLSREKLKGLKGLKIDRLSLGIQSLDDEVIKIAKRTQTKEKILEYIRYIKELEFPYLNIDLMAGLPKQTLESFLDDMNVLLSFKPDVIHINPFCNVYTSKYPQEYKLDIQKLIKSRNLMMNKAKKLLLENGYKRYGFEAFQLKKGGEEYQREGFTDVTQCVLGLGVHAVSNFPEKITFCNSPKNGNLTDCSYKGYRLTQRYSMARYATLHLLKGINLDEFRVIFDRDLLAVFKREIEFLEKIHKITIKGRTIQYSVDWDLHGLFDYFSYTKIFFGEDVLDACKEKYKDKFDPKEDYSSSKYLLRILDDSWIMSTYYDLGI